MDNNIFVRALEQYTVCMIAKDAGSKWGKPHKVFRMVEDAMEAINSLTVKGDAPNMFTGLVKEANQPQLKPAPANNDAITTGFDQVLDRLDTIDGRVSALEQK